MLPLFEATLLKLTHESRRAERSPELPDGC